MGLLSPRDFKSLASANFATPAAGPQWRDSSIGVYVGQGRCRKRKQPSPHYSRALLLQSRIRRCDKLGRMFHSAQAGGLAAQSVNILFKDASLPPGSARPSRWATPRFRDEPS